MTYIAPRQILFAVILLTSFCLHSLLLVISTEQQTYDNRKQKGERMAAQLIDEAALSLAYQDRVSLSVIANRYTSEYDVTRLTIKNNQNKILVQTGEAPLQQGAIIEQEAIFNNNNIGSVSITMQDTSKGEIFSEKWEFIVISFFLHLVVWWLYGYVARPTTAQLQALSRDIHSYFFEHYRQLNSQQNTNQQNDVLTGTNDADNTADNVFDGLDHDIEMATDNEMTDESLNQRDDYNDVDDMPHVSYSVLSQRHKRNQKMRRLQKSQQQEQANAAFVNNVNNVDNMVADADNPQVANGFSAEQAPINEVNSLDSSIQIANPNPTQPTSPANPSSHEKTSNDTSNISGYDVPSPQDLHQVNAQTKQHSLKERFSKFLGDLTGKPDAGFESISHYKQLEASVGAEKSLGKGNKGKKQRWFSSKDNQINPDTADINATGKKSFKDTRFGKKLTRHGNVQQTQLDAQGLENQHNAFSKLHPNNSNNSNGFESNSLASKSLASKSLESNNLDSSRSQFIKARGVAQALNQERAESATQTADEQGASNATVLNTPATTLALMAVKIVFVDKYNLLPKLASEAAQPYYNLCTQLLEQAVHELLEDLQLSGVYLANEPQFDAAGATVVFGCMPTAEDYIDVDDKEEDELDELTKLNKANSRKPKTAEEKVAWAGVMFGVLYKMLNQIIYDKHRELKRFALPVRFGVTELNRKDAIKSLMKTKSKHEILLLLATEPLKIISRHIKLGRLNRPTSVYERECVYVEGEDDQTMMQLIAVRNRVLMTGHTPYVNDEQMMLLDADEP